MHPTCPDKWQCMHLLGMWLCSPNGLAKAEGKHLDRGKEGKKERVSKEMEYGKETWSTYGMSKQVQHSQDQLGQGMEPSINQSITMAFRW